MQDQYDTIRRARALLATVPKSKARESSAADYTAKVERLRRRGDGHGGGMLDGAIAEALKTTKKTSWQASRAALIFAARNGLDAYLAEQDKFQRALKAFEAMGRSADWSQWRALVVRVDDCAHALQAVLDAKLPIDGRSARHTKRQDMRGLPPDWRELVINRMPGYAPAALTAAVTGCRPAELVSGVHLSIEGGELVALIRGAKVDVAAGKGQEWRRLVWAPDHANEMVQALRRSVHEAGGQLVVAIASASNFSKAMSNAAAREWPKRKTTLTPYCFRHQVAADMKGSGALDSGEISAALGHLSDATKSTYGHANMSKGRGVAPSKVMAARPVKARVATKLRTVKAAK